MGGGARRHLLTSLSNGIILSSNTGGEGCMNGRVWYDEKRQTWRMFFPPNIYRQNKHNKEPLNKFLNRLRHEIDEDTFDERDWQADRPLGLVTLTEKYLVRRRGEVLCFRNLRCHLRLAVEYFGDRNIKTIGYQELDDFSLALARTRRAKTVHNILSSFHAFFQYVEDREVGRKHGFKMPKFPRIKFELKRRRTITREQQLQVLDWLKENAPFKVWLGIKWLMTYINVRPGELISIREGDIDREQGVIYVRDRKGRRTKSVPLLDEDDTFVKTESSLPHLRFFRHEEKEKGNNQFDYQGRGFGKDHLYRWWRRACKDLGLSGVDLYGGTRHSRTQYLALMGVPVKDIDMALGDTTTECARRYYTMPLERLKEIYGTGQVVEMRKRDESAT